MKRGSRRWRSMALGVAAVVAVGAAGSLAPRLRASWGPPAQAQTTPISPR